MRGLLRILSVTLVAVPVVSVATETGMSTLYRHVGKADFVVGGVSTRQFESRTPQDDVFSIYLPPAPNGSTLLKAYVNWSYMSNFVDNNGQKTVRIQGTNVGPNGITTSSADVDCNWGTQFGMAYTADITAIVQARGFDAIYQIESAVDDPESGGMGEGMSIVAVYSNPNLPDKDVSLYNGYISTRSGDCEGMMTFGAYVGGGVHFFLNALDGQKDFGPAPMTDNFYLNSLNASVNIGGEMNNAWQGKRRFNFVPNTDPNHMYDHAELDVSSFMNPGNTSLRYDTDGFDDFGNYTDAIGHSFGAIAVPVPEPMTLLGLAAGMSALIRRRRKSCHQNREEAK